MKISHRGRYALRSMMYLCMQTDDEKVSLGSIAKGNDISVKYLEQIFADLRKAGIVNSMKGIKGGYYLEREPSEITVEQVLNAVEGEYRIKDEDSSRDCLRRGISSTIQRRVIDEINRQTGRVIEGLTLQDLVDDYNRTEKNIDEMYYI